MNNTILKYYNKLAKTYDQNRFGNSYGKFIHQQESKILSKYLNKNDTTKTIDIACGTGRFLEYASTGLDFSPEMVNVAKGKFPKKDIKIGDAKNIPYKENSFKNAMAFHLFMHLNQSDFELILEQVHETLQKDGLFIFDIPSQKRRTLTNYKAKDWHGGFQISAKTLQNSIGNRWELVNFHGIGFFPIHLIPKKIRKYFVWLDSLFCNSILKSYSSHLIFILQKK